MNIRSIIHILKYEILKYGFYRFILRYFLLRLAISVLEIPKDGPGSVY